MSGGIQKQRIFLAVWDALAVVRLFVWVVGVESWAAWRHGSSFWRWPVGDRGGVCAGVILWVIEERHAVVVRGIDVRLVLDHVPIGAETFVKPWQRCSVGMGYQSRFENKPVSEWRQEFVGFRKWVVSHGWIPSVDAAENHAEKRWGLWLRNLYTYMRPGHALVQEVKTFVDGVQAAIKSEREAAAEKRKAEQLAQAREESIARALRRYASRPLDDWEMRYGGFVEAGGARAGVAAVWWCFASTGEIRCVG